MEVQALRKIDASFGSLARQGILKFAQSLALETISRKVKTVRFEAIFLVMILTLMGMASSIEAGDEGPQVGTTIPIDAQINASEVQSQNSMIGSNVSSAVFSLNWQNMGSDLEMTLRSPSGGLIDQSAGMPIVYAKEKLDTYYIVPAPEPGNWTAIIEAKNVSSKGEEYVFFVAQVLSKTKIANNETQSDGTSDSANQTNSS
jgi:hypothetical protein